jgi:hypothetical protein
VPAAISMLTTFVAGFPLRMLVVVVSLVPVMGVMVTVLTHLSGKRRAGGGGGSYSGRTNYSRRTSNVQQSSDRIVRIAMNVAICRTFLRSTLREVIDPQGVVTDRHVKYRPPIDRVEMW